jgi:hypothetical protein
MLASKIISQLEQHEIDFTEPEQAAQEYRSTKAILLNIIRKQHKALNVSLDFLKALESIEKYKQYGVLAKERLETINKILGD